MDTIIFGLAQYGNDKYDTLSLIEKAKKIAEHYYCKKEYYDSSEFKGVLIETTGTGLGLYDCLKDMMVPVIGVRQKRVETSRGFILEFHHHQ